MNIENRIVYRYMNMKGIIPTLRKHALRAANPKNFDDPNEFKYRHVGITRKQAKAKLKKLNRQASSKLYKNAEERDEAIKRMIEVSKKIDIRDKIQKKFRICCFTQRNDNDYMWKRYADDYRGAVLEFFFHKRARTIDPIYYSNEFPQFNPLAPSNYNIFKNIGLHKLKNPFEKEEELRQFIPFGKKQREVLEKGSKRNRDFLDASNKLYIGFEPCELIGVYIGDRAPKKTRRKIIKILSRHIYSHVKLYRLIRGNDNAISFSNW